MKIGGDLRLLGVRYTYVQTRVTTIAAGYLQDKNSATVWTQWEMLRESIQNCADEADRLARENHSDGPWEFYTIHTTGKYVTLRDRGHGVDWGMIIGLGNSGKRDDDKARGEKGEGESNSFLVAAQNGIDKVLASKDWALRARLVNEDGYRWLAFDLYHTDTPITGTLWRYEATPEVLAYMADLEHYAPCVAPRTRRAFRAVGLVLTNDDDRSRLFDKGLYVKDIGAVFSYNLDLQLNRDRNMTDEGELVHKISRVLAGRESAKPMTDRQLMEFWAHVPSVPDALEYREPIYDWYCAPDLRTRFRKAFDRAWPHSCILTDSLAATEASALGWRVLQWNDHITATAKNMDVRTDRDAVGLSLDGARKVKATMREAQLLKLLEKLADRLNLEHDDVKCAVADRFGQNVERDQNLLGMFSPKEHTLYILRQMFDRSKYRISDLIRVFLHELGHHTASDHYQDFSRIFELGWADLLVALVDARLPINLITLTVAEIDKVYAEPEEC